MDPPHTMYISEHSVTIYSREKSCEHCGKKYARYTKFLEIRCCGARKRYCFKCNAEDWVVPCRTCRGKGRTIENDIVLNKWKKGNCLYYAHDNTILKERDGMR